MTWIIIVVILVLVTIWGVNTGKKVEKVEGAFNEDLKAKGIDLSSKVFLGKYVGGHPDLDNTLTNVFSFKHNRNLILYAKLYESPGNINSIYFNHLADIPIDNIKNISIEDVSSIEKKVTLGRVLLVGIFALAWKRQKKNEQAFLNITWADSKYEHETLFQFSDQGAFQEANKVRNTLIKLTR